MQDRRRAISMFLCGDVMTGRGIDQILPHPGNPALYESYIRDARDYVRLAESVAGPIPRPVDSAYIWGDALGELARADVRIVNLETSITVSEDYWHNKPVLYRMHPGNIECLTAARIDYCGLANNHVLDWGYGGLTETLATLQKAGIASAGAGENAAAAAAPAVLDVAGKGRVRVFAFGSPTSGVPYKWAATDTRPGVNLLPDLSESTARRIAAGMLHNRRPKDITIASIHWGSNWGYEVPAEQIAFAHGLIDAGISVVHGHSSHHVRPLEIYRNRLILYGCGDLLTDYEGITGYEEFRGDLALLYLLTLDAEHGELLDARLVPVQTRRFQLHHASAEDAAWLCRLLNELGARFQTQVEMDSTDSQLGVRPLL